VAIFLKILRIFSAISQIILYFRQFQKYCTFLSDGCD
jgi:hypothetical protein